MVKIDINKYKEEDISNISKEETPIVKELNKRQTRAYLITFIAVILAGADAYLHDEIGKVLSTVIIVILVAIALCFGTYSVMVSRRKDKIQKWQVNELYKSVRERNRDGE